MENIAIDWSLIANIAIGTGIGVAGGLAFLRFAFSAYGVIAKRYAARSLDEIMSEFVMAAPLSQTTAEQSRPNQAGSGDGR